MTDAAHMVCRAWGEGGASWGRHAMGTAAAWRGGVCGAWLALVPRTGSPWRVPPVAACRPRDRPDCVRNAERVRLCIEHPNVCLSSSLLGRVSWSTWSAFCNLFWSTWTAVYAPPTRDADGFGYMGEISGTCHTSSFQFHTLLRTHSVHTRLLRGTSLGASVHCGCNVFDRSTQ
eukprot:649179-Prymnesium_polylepis.1